MSASIRPLISDRTGSSSSHPATLDRTSALRLKFEIDDHRATLHTLRKNIRARVETSAPDVKAAWYELELDLEAVERAGENLTEASRDAMRAAVSRVKAFGNAMTSRKYLRPEFDMRTPARFIREPRPYHGPRHDSVGR